MTEAGATSGNAARESGPSGRWRVWLGAILLLLVLAWCGVWYAAYRAAGSAIDRITATQRVNCTERSLSGFPLRLDFRCDRGAMADGEGLSAALSGIQASAPLYWPGYVEAMVTGPLVINEAASGLALTSSWTQAVMHAEAGIGGLKRFGASFLDYSLENTGRESALPLKAVSAESADVSITPGNNRSYLLAFSGKALRIETSERTFPSLDADAQLTALDLGRNLGFDPAAEIRDWLARGGTLRIDRLRFASGGAAIGATGELSLSPAGLLSGRVTVQVGGIEKLADVVESFLPGSRERLDQVVAVLSAMPEGDSPDGPVRKLPLQIRDGNVSFGFIPLGSIPAIQLSPL